MLLVHKDLAPRDMCEIAQLQIRGTWIYVAFQVGYTKKQTVSNDLITVLAQQ